MDGGGVLNKALLPLSRQNPTRVFLKKYFQLPIEAS